MSRTVRPCGEDAILVEVGGLQEVLGLTAAVRRRLALDEPDFAHVLDVVPAAQTVLVIVTEGAGLGRLPERLAELPAEPADTPDETTVEIPVRYDGPDLDTVAERTGLSRREVVLAHTGTPWRVGFGGFAPGFAYLVGGDERLRVPRREEPRAEVPAGSVALAGEFSAVYPRASPGGWQLIGRTDLSVWDPDRDPPTLLQPGTVVSFVDVAG